MPIATFFHAQTVASMASLLISQTDTPAWSSLVPLQPDGGKTPLFAIHGWGGYLYAFVHLAQAFAPDRPVYGLQAVGLDGKTPRHSTVEAMAEHYCAQIRSLQPSGPYHIVGYSLGGWIAYAVAHRLLDQGGSIGLLALLDTHATANVHTWLKFDEWLRLGTYLVGRVPHHVGKFFRRPEEGRVAHMKKCLSSQRYYLSCILKKKGGKSAHVLMTQAGSSQVSASYPLVSSDHFFIAHQYYRPPRLNHKVHLITTKLTSHRAFLFWYYYARRRVKIHRLFDDHYDYFKADCAEPLAALLRQLLDENENPGKGV